MDCPVVPGPYLNNCRTQFLQLGGRRHVMKRQGIVSVLLILHSALFFCTTASAISYFGYDTYGGTWHDADKTAVNTEDDLMCWAAATSNVLAYTGWGFPQGQGFSNSDQIFSYFQKHWTDEGGNIFYGVDWWFDGSNDTQGDSGWSQVEIPGGGFYRTKDPSNHQLWSSSDQYAVDNIEYMLKEGYGVGISLTGPSGHAVTTWGYEYDTDGNYTGIYITDSDDNLDGLQYYDLTYIYNSTSLSHRWYLEDYLGWGSHNSGYYITEVYGLDIYPRASASVPEPATMLLFGIGLTAIAGWRLRNRRGKS